MELFFLFLILIAFLVVRLVSTSPRYKGKVGERKVIRKLSRLIDGPDGCIAFHDVTLRTPDGSTQIDHILLSPCGIFVIETKNMGGWIFGGEWQKRWVQVKFRRKSFFQNPIHQNYKHVKAIQSLLSVNQKHIFNVVVFVGDAKFKTTMPDNVLKLKSLLPFIIAHEQLLLDRSDLVMYASIISKAISGDPITEKEHLMMVNDNRTSPLCPKCGSQMVLRVARKGSGRGKQFWGCVNFPVCRGIKNVG